MTTGRTPAEAANNYRRDVQRPLSCVTDGVVGVDGGYYPSPYPHFLAMSSGRPATLGGPSQNYRIAESGLTGDGWQVAVVGYNYAVLRVLIEEMGVEPRRSDWDSILAE